MQSSAQPRRSNRRYVGCLNLGLGSLVIAGFMIALIWWVNNRPPQLEIPSHTLPAQNGYDSFVRAGQLAGNLIHKSPASLAPKQAEQARLPAHLRALVKELAPAHDQLRAGLKLECMQPSIRTINDVSAQSKNMGSIRTLCRELSGEALYYQQANQPRRAIDTLLDGAEMCAKMSHGAGTMGVPYGPMNICLAQLEPLLSKLVPADLSHVGSRLDRILNARVSFSQVMHEEARIEASEFISSLSDPRSRDYSAILNSQDFADSIRETKRSTVSRHLKAAQFMLANKTSISRSLYEYINKLAEESALQYTGSSKIDVPDLMDAEMNRWLYDQYRPNYLGAEARLVLLRLEVALLQYKVAHGKFPATLTELAPKHIGKLPDDPFAGREGVPPIYRVNSYGDDYVMYSLGPDVADNGGQPVDDIVTVTWAGSPMPGDSYFPNQRGDIVAGKLFPINR